MKIIDDKIKKAFEQMEIPEPSESTRNRAIQEAVDEFAKKNILDEKKSKGFVGFFRQMGKTLFKLITLKGEPIMTQRQFATVGILVIAVGLIVSVGPQVFHISRTVVDQQVTQTPQVRPQVVDTDLKQVPEKQKGNELVTASSKPDVSRDVREAENVQEKAAKWVVWLLRVLPQK